MKPRVDLTNTLLEMVRNGRCEERYMDSVYDAVDYINANKEQAEQGKIYVCLEDIQKFPIRKDHCDKENGNPHFIYGVETVMEYIETLPRYKMQEEQTIPFEKMSHPNKESLEKRDLFLGQADWDYVCYRF